MPGGRREVWRPGCSGITGGTSRVGRRWTIFPPADDLVSLVALGKQKSTQIGMVYPGVRRGRDDRLGMKSHTKAGGLYHVQIVGAVADGQSRIQRQSPHGRELGQRVQFRIAIEDR